ncbi:MAG: hypothetical protein ACKPCP_00410 [Sphaerospermopsis kisseleviana]
MTEQREPVKECPGCGSTPEHWRRNGFDHAKKKKYGIYLQIYRCSSCGRQFRGAIVPKPLEDGEDKLSEKMEQFKRQLKQLPNRFLSERDISYNIGVAFPGWWDKHPETYDLYKQAVDKPRLEKLTYFLKRTSPQDTTLNSISLISQKTGIGMGWISGNKEAIELIDQHKKGEVSVIEPEPEPDPEVELEEQLLYVQHVPACGLNPAQSTEVIEPELTDFTFIEAKIDVIESDTDTDISEADLLNTLRIELEAKNGHIERLSQEIVNLVTELNNGGNSETLKQNIAANRAVISDLNSQIAQLSQENEQLRLAANATRTEIEATKTAYATVVQENNRLKKLADPMVSIAAIVDNLTQEIETKQRQLNAAKLLQESVKMFEKF